MKLSDVGQDTARAQVLDVFDPPDDGKPATPIKLSSIKPAPLKLSSVQAPPQKLSEVKPPEQPGIFTRMAAGAMRSLVENIVKTGKTPSILGSMADVAKEGVGQAVEGAKELDPTNPANVDKVPLASAFKVAQGAARTAFAPLEGAIRLPAEAIMGKEHGDPLASDITGAAMAGEGMRAASPKTMKLSETLPNAQKYKLLRSTSEAEDLGTSQRPGRFVYQVQDNIGNRVGFIDIDKIENGNARIGDIVIKGKNAVGPTELKNIFAQLKEQHPEITTLSGKRVSGIRKGGEEANYKNEGSEITVPAPKTPVSGIFTPDSPVASTKAVTTPGGISDRLYADKQRAMADAQELGKFVKQNPVPHETAVKFGLYEDDPKNVKLTPQEQALYDKIQKPMLAQIESAKAELKNSGYADPDALMEGDNEIEYGKGGAIRQVKGKNTPMDRLMGTQEKTPLKQRVKDMVTPVGKRSLSKSAGVIKPRSMFAMEENGTRRIVHVKDDGTVVDAAQPDKSLGIIENGKVKTETGEGELTQATRKEITDATKGRIQYHENAVGVTATALLQARRAVRVTRTLKELAKSPQAASVVRGPLVKLKDVPKDWVEIPGVPALRGQYFEPRFAEEIEDHLNSTRRNFGELRTLESLNRFMLASFFWLNPAHIYNVAEAFAVTKGATGFFADLPRTAVDFVKSVKSVVTRDKLYMQQARAGVPLRGLDGAAQKFSTDLLAAMGERSRRDPQGFMAFAKALGYDTPIALIKKVSQLSHDATFSFQDMLQQTLERGMSRKGIGQARATENIARTLPNYRTPARLLGSRFIGKAMKGSAWFQFPGWDVGRLTGLGNMLKGAAKLDPKSLDQLLMIAVLYEFGKQVANPAVQQLTSNKAAEGPTAGYGVFPKAAEDFVKGDKSFAQVSQSLFPFGYIPKFASIWPMGVNTYTGQPLSLPGENPAEIGFDYLKALGQDIDPIRRLMDAKAGKGDLRSNVAQQLGAKVPTYEVQVAKAKAKKYLQEDLKHKRKKEPEAVSDSK